MSRQGPFELGQVDVRPTTAARYDAAVHFLPVGRFGRDVAEAVDPTVRHWFREARPSDAVTFPARVVPSRGWRGRR